MRILHIEKFLSENGGVGSYLRTLCKLQKQRGHDVFQFGCVEPGGRADMPVFHDYAESKNPMSMWKMIHNRQAASKLDEFLSGCEVDVAHLHNIYHHLTPSILPVLAKRNIGVVMTLHDYRLACPTKHFLRLDGICTRCLGNRFYHAASPKCAGLAGAAAAIESYVQYILGRYVRHIDFFLCPTLFMRDVMLKAGMPADKLRVVRNVIEEVELPDVPQSENDLLFAGRVSQEKAPELMLELAGRIPESNVVIAGGGPALNDLREKAEGENLSNVEITGPVDHSRIGQYMARATAVVVTSRCLENSPAIMLEAMAAGRCVIAPETPPLREFIHDDKTGRLFEQGDIDSLVQTTKEVLASKSDREKIAQAGKEHVGLLHNNELLIKQVEQLYEESLNRCASQ